MSGRAEDPIIRYSTLDGATEEEFDEFIAYNATVHVECMGGPQWWIGVTLADGRSWAINVGGANPNAKGFGICEADQ